MSSSEPDLNYKSSADSLAVSQFDLLNTKNSDNTAFIRYTSIILLTSSCTFKLYGCGIYKVLSCCKLIIVIFYYSDETPPIFQQKGRVLLVGVFTWRPVYVSNTDICFV